MENIRLFILLTLLFCLKSRVQSECPINNFGYNCQSTCHCEDNSKCNKTDGRCHGVKCEKGYMGEYCQDKCPKGKFGNNCQSTCHCEDNSKCNKTDGRCRGVKCERGYMGENCQKQCPKGKFGYDCKSTCHCKDNSKCNKTDGRCHGVKCEKGYKGRNCQKICPNKRFGKDCQIGCHCRYYQQCTLKTCLCNRGWTESGCNQKCPKGKFGYNCQSTCHCEDNSKCNIIDGLCTDSKCEKGYIGGNCQKLCPHKRFGNYCHDGCHCNNSAQCILERCSCANGWKGTGCNEECPTGKFGYYCQSTCHCANNSECSKTDGKCLDLKCEKGYRGSDCQKLCPHKRFGNYCHDGCHCNNSAQCILERCSCANGWKGTGCNEECPTGKFGYYCQSTCHCANNSECSKTDGKCLDLKCEKGYRGSDCQKLCPHKRFGNYCHDGCHCNNSAQCILERCSCANGWKGTGCNEECPTGKFGYYCQSTCHCANNSECSKTDGKCLDLKCEKGYRGSDCQKQCDNGTFGDGCQLKCHCANNSQCNHNNGTCPDGKCADGYKGDNCQEVKSDFNLPLVLVAVLIIVINIGVGIAFCKWRKSKKKYDYLKKKSKNDIPMERGNFQQTGNTREDIDSENIYQNVAVLTKDNLLSYIEQKKMEEVPFSNEFSRLLNNAEYPCEASKLSENHYKNRYKTVLPYDHSRVILSSNKTNTDYINANYIHFQGQINYIATQGPLESTITDFWRMIWEVKCNTIIMLTNIIENGKMRLDNLYYLDYSDSCPHLDCYIHNVLVDVSSEFDKKHLKKAGGYIGQNVVKCFSYCPDFNEMKNYGTFKICCVQEEQCRIYTHRVLTVIQCSTQKKRSVHHFHCTIWPDYGVIEEPSFFLEFRNAIRYSHFSKPPFVVHCSAGIGRTGTYIALDILLEQLLKKSSIDVFSCVNQLRHQRISMVQKLIQYQFIYDVLAEEVLTGLSEILVNSMLDEFKQPWKMKADRQTRRQKPYKEYWEIKVY